MDNIFFKYFCFKIVPEHCEVVGSVRVFRSAQMVEKECDEYIYHLTPHAKSSFFNALHATLLLKTVDLYLEHKLFNESWMERWREIPIVVRLWPKKFHNI